METYGFDLEELLEAYSTSDANPTNRKDIPPLFNYGGAEPSLEDLVTLLAQPLDFKFSDLISPISIPEDQSTTSSLRSAQTLSSAPLSAYSNASFQTLAPINTTGLDLSARSPLVSALSIHSAMYPMSAPYSAMSEATLLAYQMPTLSLSDSENLKCTHPDCGKTFASKISLRSHLKIHETSKDCVCPHPGCNAAFRRSHDLKRHVRTLHEQSRSHVCPGCDKAFGRSDALKRHLNRPKGSCRLIQMSGLNLMH